MADRVPPCDLDAERAVVSAALVSPDALGTIRDLLKPEHFFDPTCRIVLSAAYAIDDSGDAIDVVTLSTRLKSGDNWTAIGGGSTLVALFDASPAVANIAEHCAIVHEKFMLRRVIDVCRLHAVTAYGDVGDVGEYCATVERDILTATDAGNSQESPQTLLEIMREEMPAILLPSDTRPVSYVPTGIWEVDAKASGGLDPYLYVCAARPGQGKTAFALSIALNVAKAGRSAAFFSLEMKRGQLGLRALSSESRVPISQFKAGRFFPDELSRITAAAAKLSELPLSIQFRAGAHMTQIRSTLRRQFTTLERKHGCKPGIAVIDYLNLVSGAKSGKGSREEEVASITRYIMNLPSEFGCPVLLLAQLNRDVEKRPNKRPILADLRESGAIEQDAYGVIFLYRDEYYHPETDAKGIAEVNFAKHRNDEPGSVEVRFNGKCVRFSSMNEEMLDDIDEISDAIGG